MDDKIREVYKRIQKEHKMVEGFRAMAAATANIDTKRSCEAKVRDSEKSIQWFEQSLRELEKKRNAYLSAQGAAPDGMSSGTSSSSASTSLPSDYPRSSSMSSTSTAMTGASSNRKVLPPTPGSGSNSGNGQQYDPRYGPPQPGQRPYNPQYPQQKDQVANFSNNGASTLSIRRKPNYTNLGTLVDPSLSFVSSIDCILWTFILMCYPTFRMHTHRSDQI
jgi:metal-dependent amidase/aminoacylase/carboxypeptidase family protein